MSDIRFNRWLHQSGTGGVSQDSSGNIGIGTTVPTMALDIRGDVNIGDTININNASGIISATTFTGTTGTFSGNVSAVDATFTGNVSIGGTLTYEDVANIDAVGIITAQSDIIVGGGLTVTGISTFNNDVKLLDSDKLKFGIGEDLQIYHTGSHSRILESGPGKLQLGSDTQVEILNAGFNVPIAQFNPGGSVVLRHNTTTRLETTNTGAVVTGILTATTFSGNLTGNVTGDLTGNLAGISSIASISSSISDTAVDIFVYDTSKDSDGGAWRKRTQNTSWYNETLNTATRGSRKEFPAVAVIVAETTQLTIYDGDDPDLPMWMVFNSGDAGGYTGPHINIASPSILTAVAALNGEIVITCDSTGSYPFGSLQINFLKDRSLIRPSVGGKESLTGIAKRNETGSYSTTYTYPALVNMFANDVAMTVLPNAPVDDTTGLPVPTIAVAVGNAGSANGGVSIIKDDGTVVDIVASTGAGGYVSYDVAFGSNNELIHTQAYNKSYASINIFDNIPSSDISATNSYSEARTYPYINSVPNIRGGVNGASTPNLEYVSKFSDDNIAFGFQSTNAKLSLLSDNKTDPTKSMVAYIASDYNTGWMHGDCKGAFLSDTDDTNVTSSNLISGATYTASDRITSYSYTNGSSTLVITDNSANADGYVNLTLGGLTASTTYVLTVTANQTYTPTAGYNCHIGNTADGTVYFEDNFTGTASQKITFKSASSGSPTLVLYSNYNGALTYTMDLRLAEFDRSIGSFSAWNSGQSATVGQKDGLKVFGTVTKTAVATGAELVAYSGFSASNYLQQPYNSDLNFGTGDFYMMAWIKNTDSTNNQKIITRDLNSTNRLQLYTAGTKMQIYTEDAGSSSYLNSTSDFTTGEWICVIGGRKSGTLQMYVNGKFESGAGSNTNVARDLSFGAGTDMEIGRSNTGTTNYWRGSIALARVGASFPSPEQIKKIYEDEKCLFHENAKATLSGSSDAVTGLAFDDTTNLLHVGTSAGRSEFQGLRRINNTTDAVTTAISASNGLVAEQ